jgi:hypothetical protein
MLICILRRCDDVGWINLVKDWMKWRVVVDTVMNFLIP